jgi:hypothetical protein
MEHRGQKAGADFLPTVLQRGEPVAVIEPSVTALTRATIKGDGYAPTATELPDSSLEFVARHIGASHRPVRFSMRRRILILERHGCERRRWAVSGAGSPHADGFDRDLLGLAGGELGQDYLRLKRLVPTDDPPGRMIPLAAMPSSTRATSSRHCSKAGSTTSAISGG